MRNKLPVLAFSLAAAAMLCGCANTERKFSRGFNNTFEIVRMGELRRNMEQTALYEGQDAAMSRGFFKGLNRTLLRTGYGVYEMVTAPVPNYFDKRHDPYDPLLT